VTIITVVIINFDLCSVGTVLIAGLGLSKILTRDLVQLMASAHIWTRSFSWFANRYIWKHLIPISGMNECLRARLS